MTPAQLADYATTLILHHARYVEHSSILDMADEHTDAGEISEDDARRVAELIETADVTVDILLLTTGPAPSSEDTPADTPAPREYRAGDEIPAHVQSVTGKRTTHSRHPAAQNRGPDGWWSPGTGVISEQRLLSEHGPVSEVPAGGGA
jgi:hypothetical protein